MTKAIHIRLLYTLFLLVSTLILKAQTSSSKQGLTSTIFTVPEGKITVRMPEDIRPGDVISGTVTAEPEGKNKKQITKNRTQLGNYVLNILEQTVFLRGDKNNFQFVAGSDKQFTGAISLQKEGKPKILQEYTIPPTNNQTQKPPSTQCIPPSHVLVGTTMPVSGSFDGDLLNTKCTIGGTAAELVAESPRDCFVAFPQNATGNQKIKITENNQPKCEENVMGVDMQITAGKLNLRRGDNTHLDIKVTGLNGLRETAKLTITNLTPHVVTMTNGNVQVVPINPRAADSANGTFAIHCPAISIAAGGFSVVVDLDLPPRRDKMPVPNPENPQDPTNPERGSGSCECMASCSIITGVKKDAAISYSVKLNAACLGSAGSGNTRVPCVVGPVTYKWSIAASGKDVADIVGKSDASAVNVNLKKKGAYTIFLEGTITCSDGTTCTFACNEEVPDVPIGKEVLCAPTVEEKGDPKMVGGLKAFKAGTSTSSTIYRDDFIALQAEGSDADLVKIKCNPLNPCPDTRSEKTVLVEGKVKFEWKITVGPGRFLKLGCGAENEKNDIGEQVIFEPPYVPLPKVNADTTFITTITLTTIDDGSPVLDAPVIKTITIKTTRKKTIPDKYIVTVTGGAADKLAKPVVAKVDGSCQVAGPTWKPGDNLAIPVISVPAVKDADKMVLGQWIVLKTQDQTDPDDFLFNCNSDNCSTAGGKKTYPDNINWEWSIISGGGKFVLSKNGQYVIYQAPMRMPGGKKLIEVKIRVKVNNATGNRRDPEKKSKIFILKIYQPGVKLSHPPPSWLPEENNSIDLTSELMYYDGGWQPALAHMCRIHYFELMDVSTEKGVCLNAPIPKEADECRDLHLKDEKGHEAWDGEKARGADCDTTGLFQQARTKRPEKKYAISVFSRDYGSYGFLRSFANVNKGRRLEGKPIYISIPVKKTDVTHPMKRQKKTEYKDNRVTIPRDIDENRIADGGWSALGGVRVSDPEKNNIDEDDNPKGDNFKGDGFTTYEEYRGFKIITTAGVAHRRLNHQVKDIFIRNESNNLITSLYSTVSELDVHKISEAQYISDAKRYVNFNFNKTTHLKITQRGLHLIDKGDHSSLLGEAHSSTGNPTVPNAEIEIRVYTTKVRRVVNLVNRRIAARDRLVYASKLATVVAHELLHGNNVCHHGEANKALAEPHDAINGLRSGNLSCVMRYDNTGTRVVRMPESPGTTLCTSDAGTGYNAGGQRFRDAANNRGNCKGQIRVSGAGGIPKQCGNR